MEFQAKSEEKDKSWEEVEMQESAMQESPQNISGANEGAITVAKDVASVGGRAWLIPGDFALGAE